MTLGPKLSVYLTPSTPAVQYAIKGFLSMAISLYLAMYANLDRPYWALISAVFLQLRPESGMVIEKALCQIGGTLIGGCVGVTIMSFFFQSPGLAIMCLTFWVSLNATCASLTRNFNLTYGFAMTAVTAILVVGITLLSNNSSQGVFDIAVARMSEIVLGATCATVVSMLIWPSRVRTLIIGHANNVVDKAFHCIELQFDRAVDKATLHQTIVETLQATLTLNNDSSAAIYEGPSGPGRARAAYLLAQRTLTLLADMQVYGRFIREYPELLNPTFLAALEDIRKTFSAARQAESIDAAKAMLVRQRYHFQKPQETLNLDTPLQRRAAQGISELLARAIIILEAKQAIANVERRRLKAVRLSVHRDYLQGIFTGARSGMVFATASLIWIATGASTMVVAMILPVIFSMMFAVFPAPAMLIKSVLKGALLGIVASMVFGYALLAPVTGSFEMLIMVFGAPLFVALLGVPSMATRLYSLGFCVVYIVLTMPSNVMTFDASSFFNRVVSVLIALLLVRTFFLLFEGPGRAVMRRRMIAGVADDLKELRDRYNDGAVEWFNGRMTDRLLRLSRADSTSPDTPNHLLEAGLTGLNLGHVSLRVQRHIRGSDESPRMLALLRRWQTELADGYQKSAWGEHDDAFRLASEHLLKYLRGAGQLDDELIDIIEGITVRIELTLERQTGVFDGPDTNSTAQPVNA
ncbi:FUSC family protein [Phytohalomonas tamaricis]|uniref:FUSC family protein n=1 Tax=Phytohalomonas tamaricis TaxID=2081032 RepID=UPI000D0B7868|nr:FUSC family protein [Phytohalomonas tamaricis]